MTGNRISNGRTPNNIPFVNENLAVLNKFSQQNGFVYFNGQRLGKTLTVSQYNNQESSISSVYNISFTNIQNIVFDGAQVKQNPYNEKQVTIVVKPLTIQKIEQYLQQNDAFVINNDYFKIKQVNSQQYNATAKQYLICNGEQPTVIRLPIDAKDMDYVKIATLGKINQNNKVTIVVRNIGVYINSTNETTLEIDSPYSSVQLIFSYATHTWMVINPFVPLQRDTVGLTKQQSIRNVKKQMLIFG